MRKLREDFELSLTQERADARKRSRAVSKGFMLEHVCPYLPNFTHHPRDARFLGDPVDFVIFDGIFGKGKVSRLTIAEIKSGSSKLTASEKSIQRAIEKGKVEFELIRTE
jgi:predicted Holliday junction resolvase-like endonuclease